MATIFFKINATQEQEVQKLMQKEGYTNKAEFFRFLVKFFKYHSPEEAHLKKATQELTDVLKKLNKKGQLNKSIEEQLSDV